MPVGVSAAMVPATWPRGYPVKLNTTDPSLACAYGGRPTFDPYRANLAGPTLQCPKGVVTVHCLGIQAAAVTLELALQDCGANACPAFIDVARTKRLGVPV